MDKTRKENLELYKYLFLSRKYDKDDNFVFNRIRNDFLICKTTYFDFIINEIVLKEFGKENERLNKKREFELIINDKCLKKDNEPFTTSLQIRDRSFLSEDNVIKFVEDNFFNPYREKKGGVK